MAARFSFTDPLVDSKLRAAITDWLREKQTSGVNIERDLVQDPYVVDLSAGMVEIRFEGRAASRSWRDWLVQVTHRATNVPGVTFEGFWDLVADRPHPSSLLRPRDDQGPES